MHQIKIFKGLEYDVEAMEKQVNDWLTRTNARVINIFGNIAPQSEGGSKGTGTQGGSATATSRSTSGTSQDCRPNR